MPFVVLLIVIFTSLWVLYDAEQIGVKKGQIKGFFDLSRYGWFAGCLLLWIIAFPAYVAYREQYVRINSGSFTQCAACEAWIAATATACPHCGHPTARADAETNSAT